MVDKVTGRPYVQIDVRALRRAIAVLNPIERDVLDFITSRTDDRNYAFPGIKDISDGCDLREADVIEIIDKLVRHGWVGYVRKDEHDPITHRQLPNTYQVNPDYVVLNPSSKYYEEAIKM